MIVGPQLILERLVARAKCVDETSSSHWNFYHNSFRYEQGRFIGLQGFGSPRRRGGFVVQRVHRLLQRPYRTHLRDRALLGIANAVAIRQDRNFDLDMMRQVLTVDLLQARVPAEAFDKLIVVIGDGFGVLTSLLLLRYSRSRVVTVNLTKTLMVDVIYAARAVPGLEIGLAEKAADIGATRLTALVADDYGMLQGLEMGLAVNIASMQEMNPAVISRYFELLRSSPVRTWFYCCNREEKRLPDGTLVRFDDYPWSPFDEVAIDELCPWHQKYYRPVPPFYFPYEGPVRHRLVRLAAE